MGKLLPKLQRGDRAPGGACGGQPRDALKHSSPPAPPALGSSAQRAAAHAAFPSSSACHSSWQQRQLQQRCSCRLAFMVAGAAGAALTAQPHTGEWAGGVELWQVVVVPAWGRVCVWRTCWLRSDAVCDVCVCACWWRSSWVYWCASASVCKRMVPAGSWLARGETVTAAVGWEHGGRQHQSGCRDGGSSPEALLSRRQRTAGDYSWVEGCGHGGTAAERKKVWAMEAGGVPRISCCSYGGGGARRARRAATGSGRYARCSVRAALCPLRCVGDSCSSCWQRRWVLQRACMRR